MQIEPINIVNVAGIWLFKAHKKTEMHRSKQSKTEKHRQNKTKQTLNELIEESNRLRHIRHERQLQKCINLIYEHSL